nr:GNAT family N-acetyltransferase [Bacillota bacterium]
MRLEGPRVVLREFELSDFEAVHAYGSDPEVVRFMVWGPNEPPDTEAFIRHARELAQQEPRTSFELAVTLRESGALIGGCGLRVNRTLVGDADIGYVLHRDYWGRGLAAEAAGLLLQLGFGQLGLSRIWATCDVENRASARVLEKIGMQREGRLRRNLLVRGRWRDSYLYAILADEWRQARDGRSP